MSVFRTFIINCTSLGLSVFWMISSVIIISKFNSPKRLHENMYTHGISTYNLIEEQFHRVPLTYSVFLKRIQFDLSVTRTISFSLTRILIEVCQ